MGYYGSNLRQHSPYEDQGHHNQNIHEVQAAKLLCLQNDKQLVKKTTIHVTGKGKAIPLQAWTSPEGSRRLRLPDFKTIGT